MYVGSKYWTAGLNISLEKANKKSPLFVLILFANKFDNLLEDTNKKIKLPKHVGHNNVLV